MAKKRFVAYCPNAQYLVPGGMWCKSNTRVAAVENDKLSFEHDVSKNLQRISVVGLDSTLAHIYPTSRSRSCKTDERTRYCGHIAIAQPNMEIGKLGIAGKAVTLRGRIVQGAWDAGVVGLHSGVIEQQERSSSVGNCWVGCRVRLDLAVSDLKSFGSELPEALRLIHRGELNSAGELGTIDFAEFVGAHGGVFEVRGKDRLFKRRHYIVEKGRLGLSLTVHSDGIDAGESES